MASHGRVTALALAASIAGGCATAHPPGLQPVRDSTIDAGAFTVPAPDGEGWGVAVERSPPRVRFERSLAHMGAPIGACVITLGESVAAPGTPLDAEGASEAFIAREVAAMRADGEGRGLYAVASVVRGDVTVAGRLLHGMRFQTGSPTAIADSILRLWFPPDFEAERRFYWMVATVARRRGAPCAASALRVADAERVLAGLSPAAER